jgi:hypothetical protein
VCSNEATTCPETSRAQSTICCGFLEHLLFASCKGLPRGDLLRSNISKQWDCINELVAPNQSCFSPPLLQFTAPPVSYSTAPGKLQGPGVAAVGSSAYIFGGSYSDGTLLDTLWQLDGAAYPPRWIDLTQVRHFSVCFVHVYDCYVSASAGLGALLGCCVCFVRNVMTSSILREHSVHSFFFLIACAANICIHVCIHDVVIIVI